MTEPIFDLVINDLRAREARGAETYGKARMEAHDGRDSLQDAYEEALDLVAYLRKAIAEREAMVAAVVEQVQAGKHVSIAEHVIERDEDYARRMGWVRDGWREDHWRPSTSSNHWPYIEEWQAGEKRLGLRFNLRTGPGGNEGTWWATLRAAVDAYAAQNGKSLAQALAEVGEDEAE